MKRIALALAAVLFAGAAAAQEPPVCTGINLLDDLKSRDPATYEAVMKEAAAVPNGEAILWKIEKDGVKPSHLLGTAHVTDPRVTKGPPGIEELIASSSKLALEVKELADDQEMAMAVMRSAPMMVMPVGKSLWDVIPDADEDAIRNSPNLPAGAAGTIFGYQPCRPANRRVTPPACGPSTISLPASPTARAWRSSASKPWKNSSPSCPAWTWTCRPATSSRRRACRIAPPISLRHCWRSMTGGRSPPSCP
jgi:hypothetical protein